MENQHLVPKETFITYMESDENQSVLINKIQLKALTRGKILGNFLNTLVECLTDSQS